MFNKYWPGWNSKPAAYEFETISKWKPAFYTITRLQSFVVYSWHSVKRLQQQDHIRMQRISCDTALVRTMAYIGSVVPCGTGACVTTITYVHYLNVTIINGFNVLNLSGFVCLKSDTDEKRGLANLAHSQNNTTVPVVEYHKFVNFGTCINVNILTLKHFKNIWWYHCVMLELQNVYMEA